MPFTVAFDTAMCMNIHWGDAGASYISFRVAIKKDGREYLATGDSIYRSHETNTFKQTQRLRAWMQGWASPQSLLDPDVQLRDFPVPPKTAFILAALNATQGVPDALAA